METIGIRYIFDIDQAEKAQKIFSRGFEKLAVTIETSRKKIKSSVADYKTFEIYYSKFPKEGIADFYNFVVNKLKKLKQIFKSTFERKKHSEQKQENSSGGIGALAVAKGLAIYNAGVGFINLGINTLKEQMPFISESFEMAGKVLSANLLYPLSRELIPIFQSFFQWVRTHRIVFVQLGTLLVSAFRIVKTAVSSAFKLIKIGIDSLWKSIGGGHLTVKKFLDYMNFLMLKIVFLFTFIEILLEPIFKGIGSSIGFLWKNVIEPFVFGFWEGFKGQIIPALNEFGFMIDELSELFSSLKSSDLSWIGTTFKFIGKVLGHATLVPLRLFIAGVRLLTGLFKDPKKAIVDFGLALWSIFAGDSIVSKLKNSLVSALNWIKSQLESFKSWVKGIWASITGFFSGVWNSISNNFDSLIKKLKDFVEPLRGIFELLTDEAGSKWKLSNAIGAAKEISGFAAGGSFPANKPIVVGEKGPEILVPSSSGNIIPNEELKPMIRSTGSSEARKILVQDNKTLNFQITNSNPNETAKEIWKFIKQNSGISSLKDHFGESSFKYS